MTELIRSSSSEVKKGKNFRGGVTGNNTCSTGGGGGGGSLGREIGASWLKTLLREGRVFNRNLVVSLNRFDMLELSDKLEVRLTLLRKLLCDTFLLDFCLKRLANSAKISKGNMSGSLF